MDEYSNRKAIDGVVVSRKGTAHAFRDAAKSRDKNGQVCNRLGCSGRANPLKGNQIGSSEKGKSLRPSIQSSSTGKEVIGSSSRTSSKTIKPRKSSIGPHKSLPSQLDTNSSESGSSVHDEPEVSELIPPPEKIQRGLQAKTKDSVPKNLSLREIGGSSVVSRTRSRRNFHQRPGLHCQDNLVDCSSSLGSKSTSQVCAGTSRYGLKNLRCNSISDVIPSGCSSSDSSTDRKKDVIKKRSSEGESSSTARGKKVSGPSSEGWNSNSRNGICISDSRRSRNMPLHREDIVSSVRTQRTVNSHARTRLSNQLSDNSLIPNDPGIVVRPGDDHDAPGLSHRISAETSISQSVSYSRPGTCNGHLLFGAVPTDPVEVGITHSLMTQDSFQHYHLDGIAEVLLALERTEQDEGLTPEQILVLETNLFLNGLNFYDQHRDMRLDIDNMSYEELLALEERMGTVSTALTEEALSECLKRSICQSAPSNDVEEGCNGDQDDIKCSICQQEYAAGDEMGILQCEHKYHVDCIQQWLRLKNWCPICKASAAPPSRPSSPS